MKILFDTSSLINLWQAGASFLKKLGASTTVEVAEELQYAIGIYESRQLLEGIEVLQSRKAKPEQRGLSGTDASLLRTAKESESFLASDDKKLLGTARSSRCSCGNTPQLIESLSQKISKAEAIEILEKLKFTYPRKKILESTLQRVRKW